MPTDKPKHLDLILKKYSDVWVALSQDETKVVGQGKTMGEALEAAKNNGCDEPVLTYAPSNYGAYVL